MDNNYPTTKIYIIHNDIHFLFLFYLDRLWFVLFLLDQLKSQVLGPKFKSSLRSNLFFYYLLGTAASEPEI